MTEFGDALGADQGPEVSAEIAKTGAAGDRALRAGQEVAHRRCVAAGTATEETLHELHRLVGSLRSRFPELEPSISIHRRTVR